MGMRSNNEIIDELEVHVRQAAKIYSMIDRSVRPSENIIHVATILPVHAQLIEVAKSNDDAELMLLMEEGISILKSTIDEMFEFQPLLRGVFNE